MSDLDPLAAQMIVATFERMEKRMDQLESAIAEQGVLIGELYQAVQEPAPAPATKN